jgi:branched-chain amino acid transport system ATP-binding protein
MPRLQQPIEVAMGEVAVLQVEGLDAAYGQAQVLFDVSLTLARGEIVALMGRNGAGKSTTLKAIMGLIPAGARVLRFDGHDILRMTSYRIFTDLTVAENLEVGAKTPADGSGRAPWTPERLYTIFPNLAEMRGRRASQMSGGEQQMLTIARTLMGNPEAVLLDEPSEGLAPVIVEQMATAVSRMKTEGITVLLSEQNLHFASAVADRTYIIEKGAIRHEGRMADIVHDAALREMYLGV